MPLTNLSEKLKNIASAFIFIAGTILIGFSWDASAGKVSKCLEGDCSQRVCGQGQGKCNIDGNFVEIDGTCSIGPISGCCNESSGTCEMDPLEPCIMQYCDNCGPLPD